MPSGRFLPLQPPDALHFLVFAAAQLSSTGCPGAIESSEPANESNGGNTGFGPLPGGGAAVAESTIDIAMTVAATSCPVLQITRITSRFTFVPLMDRGLSRQWCHPWGKTYASRDVRTVSRVNLLAICKCERLSLDIVQIQLE